MPERLIVTPLEARIMLFNEIFYGHDSKEVAKALHGSDWKQWYHPEYNPLKLEDIMQDAQRSQLFSERIDDALNTLADDRARIMIKLRFGLYEDGAGIKTLEEVGKEFGVTRERPRVIIAQALRKLSHPSRSKNLREFLPENPQ